MDKKDVQKMIHDKEPNEDEEHNKNIEDSFRDRVNKDTAQVGRKMVNFAKKIPKITNGIILVVTNPITWLILLIGGLILITQAGINTIGQSDYGNNCVRQSDSSGGSSGGAGKIGHNAKVHVTIPDAANHMQGEALARYLAKIVGEKIGIKDPSWIFAQICLESGISNPSTWNRAVASKNLTGINGGPDTKFSTWSEYASVWASTLVNDGAKHWKSLSDMNDFLSGKSLGKDCNYYCYKSPDSHWSSQAAEARAYLGMLQGWAKKYNGHGDKSAGNGSDGSTAHCDNVSVASTNNILKFAISIAWPDGQYKKSLVNGDSKGANVATKAYKAAMAAAGMDPQHYYASCDGFVATVIRNTVDGSYPWHATDNQLSYVKSHTSKYKKIPCKDVKGGDIIFAVTKSGAGDQHTFIWWKESKNVSASLGQRVGGIDHYSAHGCSGNLIAGADGHSYGQAFRFIGTPHPYKK